MLHFFEQHLVDFSRKYPEAWKTYDKFLSLRGTRGIPSWPDWCFCPMAAAYAIVSGGDSVRLDHLHHIAAIGALAAWRVGKGVYEFNQTLEEELWNTPLAGDIPSELLTHLPEWCPYVLLQNPRDGILGFWVHLEFDSQDFHTELRVVLDMAEPTEGSENLADPGKCLMGIPLHIDGKVTVEDALRRMIDYGEFQSKKIGFSGFVTPKEEIARKMGASLQGVISMVLYLCQKNVDLRPINKAAQDAGHPKNPPPQKTKRGPRYFAAEAKHWECGFRIGPALEEAKRSVSCPGDEMQATRRAHLRRAHWHTYWTGKGRLKPEVKWLHPILVGTADETVPTVREVPCKK